MLPKDSKLGQRRYPCRLTVLVIALFACAIGKSVGHESPNSFKRYAKMLRQAALIRISPRLIMVPSLAATASPQFRTEAASADVRGGGRWRVNITTTVFWVGEQATENNPVPNDKSAWDVSWLSSYGGYDNPNREARVNFAPTNFLPRQNPFYIALPYNDVESHRTKPEAAKVIPWFQNMFVRDGLSVCKGTWLAIRKGSKVCYAQWEDVGPFTTDDWQYVFGGQPPRPNRNQNAGLDVSPAVRDFLGLSGLDSCDWKFVNARQVPAGPWGRYGMNNTFANAGLRTTKSAPKYAEESESHRPSNSALPF